MNVERFARDVVCVAASRGGVRLLTTLVAALPPELPAGIVAVQHRGRSASRGTLPQVLQGRARLLVVEPHDGEPFRRSTFYIAPPGFHMIIERGCLHLHTGPREHFTRPAADPLFRSAAAEYGPRVLGVVLSGGGTDGAEGCRAITAAGGISIAQAPWQAEDQSMPRSTIALAHLGGVLPLVLPMKGIIGAIVALAHGQAFQCPPS